MAQIEPIPGKPAATGMIDGQQVLLIADYHAGIESAIEAETGVTVESQAASRRSRLLGVLDQTGADRLVILGDLMHSIGDPGGAERGELEVLIEQIPAEIQIDLIKGNHDGAIESWVPRIDIAKPGGLRIGPVGLTHGHVWPTQAVLEAEVICMGHEHPVVNLTDDVGGSRTEPAWLRGPIATGPFEEKYGPIDWTDPELVVFPAFNNLVGGTWINDQHQEFLAPFLPAGLQTGTAFLLDGTNLGDYQRI